MEDVHSPTTTTISYGRPSYYDVVCRTLTDCLSASLVVFKRLFGTWRKRNITLAEATAFRPTNQFAVACSRTGNSYDSRNETGHSGGKSSGLHLLDHHRCLEDRYYFHLKAPSFFPLTVCSTSPHLAPRNPIGDRGVDAHVSGPFVMTTELVAINLTGTDRT